MVVVVLFSLWCQELAVSSLPTSNFTLMTKGKKRAGMAQDSAQQPTGKEKRVKTTGTEKKPQPTVVMSLQCIQVVHGALLTEDFYL